MSEKWWKPVLIFYAKTTSWIIFPMGFALILNRFFIKDSQYGFFILVAFGFGITCRGIYKEIKKYQQDLDKENQDKKNGK